MINKITLIKITYFDMLYFLRRTTFAIKNRDKLQISSNPAFTPMLPRMGYFSEPLSMNNITIAILELLIKKYDFLNSYLFNINPTMLVIAKNHLM